MYAQLALMGASALAGWLRNRHKQQSTSSTTPTTDPKYGGLEQALIEQALSRLRGEGPEIAQGIAHINDTYEAANRGLSNSLTARGLASSPIAGNAEAQLATARAGDISQYRQTAPLQGLQLAQQLLSMGRGQQTTGTNSITQGGGWAGTAENVAGMLGWLYGQGALGNKLPKASANRSLMGG